VPNFDDAGEHIWDALAGRRRRGRNKKIIFFAINNARRNFLGEVERICA